MVREKQLPVDDDLVLEASSASNHQNSFRNNNFLLHFFSHFIGFRIGKGEGYADMEYGMMVSMGAVNDSTVVVTVVHDCQVGLRWNFV